jgi:exopolysaccharide biosynthesis polyprenyl glycosylphosphotransferase
MEDLETKKVPSSGAGLSGPAGRRQRSALSRGLIVWLLDLCCIGVSLFLGLWLRVGSGLGSWGRGEINPNHWIAVVVIGLAWSVIFSFEGLYRRTKILSGLGQLVSIVRGVTLGFLLLLGLSFVFKEYYRYYFVETRAVVAFGWILSVATLSAVRIGLVRSALKRAMRVSAASRRAVVVGAIPFARRVIGTIMPSTNGYEVMGFVETREGEISSDLGPELVLGKITSLDDVVSDYGIQEIFLPLAQLESRSAFDIISRCSRTGLPIRLVSDMFQVLMPEEPKEKVDGVPQIGLSEPALKGMGLVAKRAVDLAVSLSVVVVFAPVFLFISALVKVFSPGPVLFRQIRAGRDGRPFTFYKFRTMRHNTDDTLHREYATNFIGGKELRLRDESSDKKIYKMPDDPRITSIGRILRKTSLDELPQIFNVLKSDMSIVGPRPPIAYELSIYKEWHKRRLRAKPGITGLWQVSGRSSVPFHDMVLLDLYYINRWSLLLDLEIMLKTVPVIVSGKGAY